MITNISTKTSGDFLLIADNAGKVYQLPSQTLLLAMYAFQEQLEAVSESWDIVDGFPDADGAEESSPGEADAISRIEETEDGFAARTEQGESVRLTPTELKTILNARDIHNAKVRGVEPPAG